MDKSLSRALQVLVYVFILFLIAIGAATIADLMRASWTQAGCTEAGSN